MSSIIYRKGEVQQSPARTPGIPRHVPAGQLSPTEDQEQSKDDPLGPLQSHQRQVQTGDLEESTRTNERRVSKVPLSSAVAERSRRRLAGKEQKDIKGRNGTESANSKTFYVVSNSFYGSCCFFPVPG